MNKKFKAGTLERLSKTDKSGGGLNNETIHGFFLDDLTIGEPFCFYFGNSKVRTTSFVVSFETVIGSKELFFKTLTGSEYKITCDE